MKSEFKTAMDVKATVYESNAKRIESELAEYLNKQAKRLFGTEVHIKVDNGINYYGDERENHHAIHLGTYDDGRIAIGVHCGGYRSPHFYVSENTLVLLENCGHYRKDSTERVSDAKYAEQFLAFLKDWDLLKEKLAREIDKMCQAQFDDAMFLENFKI